MALDEQPGQDLGLEFRRYLTILHRRKGLVATCLLLSMLVATLYNYTARPVYRSTAQILVSRSNPNILPGQQTNLLVEASDIETQLQLLRSRSLAERVVEALELQKTTEFKSGPLMSPWERFRRKFLGWKETVVSDGQLTVHS